MPPGAIYGPPIQKFLSGEELSPNVPPFPLLIPPPLPPFSELKDPWFSLQHGGCFSLAPNVQVLTPAPPRSIILPSLLTRGLPEALGARQGARGSPVA